MNIRLPKDFRYEREREYAIVKGKILYIYGFVSYEEVIYKLTYKLRGEVCQYCKKKLSEGDRTLDHVYPRAWGGISIPNNLVPACSKCNQEKRVMTFTQYQKYLKIIPDKEKENYYKECLRENEEIIRKRKYILPKKWLTEYDISEIVKNISFKDLKQRNAKKIERHYETWKQYPYPIIVSGNGHLFQGMHVLNHAKKHGRKKVPAIVLENVIVERSSQQ